MIKKITENEFEAFRQGDNKIFRQIFDSFYNQTLGFIHKIIKSEPDAEELAQNVFLKLWNNRNNIQSSASLYAYLFKIAKNESLQYIISKSHKKTTSIEQRVCLIDKTADVEDHLQARELDMYINMLISEMPTQRRKIFRMSRVEGVSNDEIAKRLNISKRTVETHIHTALTYLKKNINI